MAKSVEISSLPSPSPAGGVELFVSPTEGLLLLLLLLAVVVGGEFGSFEAASRIDWIASSNFTGKYLAHLARVAINSGVKRLRASLLVVVVEALALAWAIEVVVDIFFESGFAFEIEMRNKSGDEKLDKKEEKEKIQNMKK